MEYVCYRTMKKTCFRVRLLCFPLLSEGCAVVGVRISLVAPLQATDSSDARSVRRYRVARQSEMLTIAARPGKKRYPGLSSRKSRIDGLDHQHSVDVEADNAADDSRLYYVAGNHASAETAGTNSWCKGQRRKATDRAVPPDDFHVAFVIEKALIPACGSGIVGESQQQFNLVRDTRHEVGRSNHHGFRLLVGAEPGQQGVRIVIVVPWPVRAEGESVRRPDIRKHSAAQATPDAALRNGVFRQVEIG